jgi:folate-binding protein YgfZ
MMANFYIEMPDRGLIAVAGDDARTFLQGLVTNNVDAITRSHAIYAALLTPQGKYLHDFFLFELSGTLYMDCEAARRDDLMGRLAMYRLRSKVTIEAADGQFALFALIGDGALDAAGLAEPGGDAGAAVPFAGGIAYIDPRDSTAGARCAVPREDAAQALSRAGFAAGAREIYERRRIALALPDGSRDMTVERSMPLEFRFEELNGIDFGKGCYVGQEVTSRIRNRGLVRRRLLHVAIEGAAPQPGTPVKRGDIDAGEMCSAADDSGLALIRLDVLAEMAESGGTLTAGDARITPKPARAEN